MHVFSIGSRVILVSGKISCHPCLGRDDGRMHSIVIPEKAGVEKWGDINSKIIRVNHPSNGAVASRVVWLDKYCVL